MRRLGRPAGLADRITAVLRCPSHVVRPEAAVAPLPPWFCAPARRLAITDRRLGPGVLVQRRWSCAVALGGSPGRPGDRTRACGQRRSIDPCAKPESGGSGPRRRPSRRRWRRGREGRRSRCVIRGLRLPDRCSRRRHSGLLACGSRTRRSHRHGSLGAVGIEEHRAPYSRPRGRYETVQYETSRAARGGPGA